MVKGKSTISFTHQNGLCYSSWAVFVCHVAEMLKKFECVRARSSANSLQVNNKMLSFDAEKQLHTHVMSKMLKISFCNDCTSSSSSPHSLILSKWYWYVKAINGTKWFEKEEEDNRVIAEWSAKKNETKINRRFNYCVEENTMKMRMSHEIAIELSLHRTLHALNGQWVKNSNESKIKHWNHWHIVQFKWRAFVLLTHTNILNSLMFSTLFYLIPFSSSFIFNHSSWIRFFPFFPKRTFARFYLHIVFGWLKTIHSEILIQNHTIRTDERQNADISIL